MIYAGVEEMKERLHREGRSKGRAEGRAEGRASLVCRQARLKFGGGVAEELARLLAEIGDADRIAGIGDRIIECDTAAELLESARRA